MAKFFGIDLHPMYIDGLHGIASWRDISIEKLLIEVAAKYPLDIPGGCRIMVKEFYAEPNHVGSRQVQRAHQRRVAEIGDENHNVKRPVPRKGPGPVPRNLLYPHYHPK